MVFTIHWYGLAARKCGDGCDRICPSQSRSALSIWMFNADRAILQTAKMLLAEMYTCFSVVYVSCRAPLGRWRPKTCELPLESFTSALAEAIGRPLWIMLVRAIIGPMKSVCSSRPATVVSTSRIRTIDLGSVIAAIRRVRDSINAYAFKMDPPFATYTSRSSRGCGGRY